MVNVKRTVQLLVAFMFSFQTHAAIEVIGNFGGEPVEIILAEIMPKEDLPEEPVKNADIEKAIKGMVTYPFSPTFATVGKFISRDFTKRQDEITSPVALIGADKISINWLRAYKGKLQEIGATVFIVEARSEKDLKLMLSSYHGQIMPLQNADKVFKQFNIQKYPILITADGAYQ